MYDVFISHKSDDKPWVRVLAKNLKAQGYGVFLDEWELVPGKSITEGLYHALTNSKKAILVASPETIESGWVREEYNQMIVQKKKDRDFSIIPVVLGMDIPDFPFMKDILWVDFRDQEKYRHSFYHLVCAVDGRIPGADIRLKGEIQLPEPGIPTGGGKDEHAFIEELFELFFGSQAVILLTQSDRWNWPVKSTLLQKARDRYGEKNVLHMVPPFSIKVNLEDFYSLLGKQCGFSREITNAASLIEAFKDSLRGDRRLFLLVSGLEDINGNSREELAGALRALNEHIPKKLQILICGAEKPADLYYSGTLSYLNHAEVLEWPEMTVKDVQRMAKVSYPSLPLNKKAAEEMLENCGGHPKILETCLALYMQNKAFSTDELVDELATQPYIWRKLVPYSEDADKSQKLCHLLNREDLGPAPPYIFDAFLRTLYWKSFLKRSSSNNRLTWRGNALRMACKKILSCGVSGDDSAKTMDDTFITGLKINQVRHLKDIAIPLSEDERKHVILTGKNGSGKTSVLECLKKLISRWEDKKDGADADEEEISLQFNRESRDFNPGYFIIAFYSARRKAEYLVPRTIKKLNLKETYHIDDQPGKEFVRYIVNLSADKSFAKEKFDQSTVEKIEKWFTVFEELLRDIFEDPGLRIEFDSKNYNYKLIQENDRVFDFNTMADGYSAIINIVTDLILRMEKHKTTNYDLQGIVLIDEVEAHLHINLQKKILPFLISFFPKVQFIVSTHSPFVLNSIENSVIYDLERNLLLSDLSAYSYEGIVEGYFDNDKYSGEAKEKIRLYRHLVEKKQRTEAEHKQMMEMRMFLSELPASLAPELKISFQEIEAERKTKRKSQKER